MNPLLQVKIGRKIKQTCEHVTAMAYLIKAARSRLDCNCLQKVQERFVLVTVRFHVFPGGLPNDGAHRLPKCALHQLPTSIKLFLVVTG